MENCAVLTQKLVVKDVWHKVLKIVRKAALKNHIAMLGTLTTPTNPVGIAYQ